jgi:hypothetical protein
MLTGVAGFEPTNGGVKVRSLTTWRHPKISRTVIERLILVLGKKGFEPLTPWFVATCSSPLSYKPKIEFCIYFTKNKNVRKAFQITF